MQPEKSEEKTHRNTIYYTKIKTKHVSIQVNRGHRISKCNNKHKKLHRGVLNTKKMNEIE